MSAPYIIKMPQLSDTMTEGTVVSWEKNVGDFIERGTVVATIETDKAIMDVEVFREGYLSGPIAVIDSVIPVGDAMATLVADKKDVVEGEGAPAVAASSASEAEATNNDPASVTMDEIPEGAHTIKMPQLSDTMTEGTMVTWEKELGDHISRGTVVATVETDKAIMDVEVFREGYLSGPMAVVDSVVPVGESIAYLVDDKSKVLSSERTAIAASAAASVTAPKSGPAGTAKPKTRIPAMPHGATPAPRPGDARATPYARQLAGAHGKIGRAHV